MSNPVYERIVREQPTPRPDCATILILAMLSVLFFPDAAFVGFGLLILVTVGFYTAITVQSRRITNTEWFTLAQISTLPRHRVMLGLMLGVLYRLRPWPLILGLLWWLMTLFASIDLYLRIAATQASPDPFTTRPDTTIDFIVILLLPCSALFAFIVMCIVVLNALVNGMSFIRRVTSQVLHLSLGVATIAAIAIGWVYLPIVQYATASRIQPQEVAIAIIALCLASISLGHDTHRLFWTPV